ncbi:GNAT family N-acetyltransferase [uncultured Vibrio sp.]|uniref:GNAT family N-acetyltransferase n=1 Tax=uncultured Vibrio sp. TaxID=114054 RepID=UPI0025F6D129|nr:GNAT family N-acetyltransferase [uncultured Vibrio sp.]
MEYIIRFASESDAAGINKVSEHLGYSQLSSTESTTKLQELLNSPQDQVFVAEWQGRIIGWLHLFYARRLASDNFFEIGGLVVSPDSRGYGIGRALVQYAQAENLGKFRVRCNEKRLDAHKFYESIGFDSSKVQRVFQVRS